MREEMREVVAKEVAALREEVSFQILDSEDKEKIR